MKLIYTLLFVYCFSAFAQKQYTFDYIIEYKTTHIKDTLIKDWTMYLLTNSKDDSYLVQLIEKDSLNFSLNFIDHNEMSSHVIINKKDFSEVEFINISCNDIVHSMHPFKELVKHYYFTKPKDTLIDNKKYITYAIKTHNMRRKKRKKIGSDIYIVDKETSFHVLVFSFPTTYETYKENGNITNGIFIKKIFSDYLNELWSIQERINYLPTNKKIIISGDCE